MSEPVTQAEIAAATVWCDNVVGSMNGGIVIGRNHMLKLLRAIAERDERIFQEAEARRDALEDLSNYRASAEEQLRLHKDALRWALEGNRYSEPFDVFYGRGCGCCEDDVEPPVELRQILLEAVRSKS